MSTTNREKRKQAKKKDRQRRVRREVYAQKGGGRPTRRGGLFGKGAAWGMPAWRGQGRR